MVRVLAQHALEVSGGGLELACAAHVRVAEQLSSVSLSHGAKGGSFSGRASA